MKNGNGTSLWRFVIVVELAAVIALGIWNKPRKKAEATEPEKPVSVRLMTLEEQSVPRQLDVVGRVNPNAEIRLAAEQPGVVTSFAADKGEFVKAGQILLELDQTLQSVALEEARAQGQDADREFARKKELFDQGAVSLSEFQAAETRRTLARAEVDRAEVLLKKRTIRSPASGWIEDRYLNAGDYAREGDPAFRLLVLDPAKIAFDIPEQAVAGLHAGQDLTFMVPALNGETRTGRLSFLARQAARENNSFRAELEAPNPEGALRPGYLTQVHLQLEPRAHAIRVPITAIIPHRGLYVVFLCRDNQAERRTVKILDMFERDAVVEGVAPGERLVIEGHRGLMDGQPIAPQTDAVVEPEKRDAP